MDKKMLPGEDPSQSVISAVVDCLQKMKGKMDKNIICLDEYPTLFIESCPLDTNQREKGG